MRWTALQTPAQHRGGSPDADAWQNNINYFWGSSAKIWVQSFEEMVMCAEKMRECKLSKQRKSLSWFAIFTAFSGDKVLSTRGDKFYEGQFLATRKTLTVSGGTLKNAKLNLDKKVPKYNSCIHILNIFASCLYFFVFLSPHLTILLYSFREILPGPNLFIFIYFTPTI